MDEEKWDEEKWDETAAHCVKITSLCQSLLHECHCSLDESMAIVTALIEICICQMIDTGTSLKEAEDVIHLIGHRLYNSLITDEGRAKLRERREEDRAKLLKNREEGRAKLLKKKE